MKKINVSHFSIKEIKGFIKMGENEILEWQKFVDEMKEKLIERTSKKVAKKIKRVLIKLK